MSLMQKSGNEGGKRDYWVCGVMSAVEHRACTENQEQREGECGRVQGTQTGRMQGNAGGQVWSSFWIAIKTD